MNPIERLVEDIERAWHDADSWVDGRNAVFAVARAFAKQHTVWPLEDGQTMWTHEPNGLGGSTYKRLPDNLRILVLREQEPTLLEAQALIVAAWDDDALTVHGRHCKRFAEGMSVLRAAIKKEVDDGQAEETT